MNTSRQILFLYATALAASACSVLWINGYHSPTSFFRFVRQDANEAVPACIRDSASKPAVLEHSLNVQAFDSDCRESVDQITRNFVVHIPAGVTHLGVEISDATLNFLSPATTTATARECPLSPAKFWQLKFEYSAIANRFAATGSNERLQANVYANNFSNPAGRARAYRKLNGKQHKPLSVVFNNGGRFDDAFCRNIAMPSHAHGADVLEPKFQVDYPASATMPRHVEGKAIETVCAFESRKPRACHRFFVSTEKSSKRIVEPAKCLLAGGDIDPRYMLVSGAENSKPATLLLPRPPCTSRFHAQTNAVKCGVVEAPMRLQHDRQLALLVGVGVEAVFERLNHENCPCVEYDHFMRLPNKTPEGYAA